jgi:hypothetical protein
MKWRPAFLCTVSALLFAGVFASAQNSPNTSPLELLHVQGNVSMLAGAGGNIAVQAGKDGVLLVDSGVAASSDALVDADGRAHPMVGVLPARVRMTPARMTLGYTEVTFAADTPLGAAGAVARGHRFHYSTLDPVPAHVRRAYRDGDGYLVDRTLMSYVHLHFASNPGLADAFVRACAEARA